MKIYVISNAINGKKYVGQTIQPIKKRWRRHLSSGHALFKAVNKYGVANFSIEVVDDAISLEELNRKEQEWIEKLNTLSPHGYNLRHGGSNGQPSLETRVRMSIAHKGKKQKKEVIEKRIAHLRGKPLDEGHREKIASAQRGEKNHKFGKPAWNRGKQHSRKTIQKIKDSKRDKQTGKANPFFGRKHTAESKAKISQNNWLRGHSERHPMLGQRHSEETKSKMRRAQQQRNHIARAVAIRCINTGREYRTILDACKHIGIGYGAIKRSLDSGKMTRHGMQFEYIK